MIKQKDVEIDGRYTAKISGRIVIVQVIREDKYNSHRKRSWKKFECKNLKTGRTVFLTAGKLRKRVDIEILSY